MKLKSIIIAVLVYIVWSTLVYLSICFYYMELNPKNWSWDGRYFQVFLGFFFGLFVALVCYTSLIKNQE